MRIKDEIGDTVKAGDLFPGDVFYYDGCHFLLQDTSGGRRLAVNLKTGITREFGGNTPIKPYPNAELHLNA